MSSIVAITASLLIGVIITALVTYLIFNKKYSEIKEANTSTCAPFCPECTEVNASNCASFCPECKEANDSNCASFCPECKAINATTCAPFFPECKAVNATNCAPFFPECPNVGCGGVPNLDYIKILGSSIVRGQSINTCEGLMSANKLALLYVQTDGDLVIYKRSLEGSEWNVYMKMSSKISNYGADLPNRLVYQGDGNVTFRTKSSVLLFNFSTHIYASDSLTLDNDGVLRLKIGSTNTAELRF